MSMIVPFELPRQKRADLVADEIKRWIVREQKRPGDRLPNERELMALFGVSKGTIRECLKSLEIQGIIRVNTGPRGGPFIAEVPYATSAELLSNYFYFKQLDAERVYEMRRVIEPQLAAAAVPHLTEEHILLLEKSIAVCADEPRTSERRREQRIEELRFHDIFVEACPNPLMAFSCRFINDLLARKVVFKSIYVNQQEEIRTTNLRYHQEIVDAVKLRDVERVRQVMHDHMVECETHAKLLDAVVEPDFLKF
jgi:GntR family transcriptional regulator, transcriptional repressor for pyruvate dehydrogenase complex